MTPAAPQAPRALRLRRVLTALVALLVALAVLPVRPAAAAEAPGRPVVVVGIPGLTWDDVTPDTMPTLAALAATGGTGDLVVRTVHDTTCPLDGWLTLGAGVRATGPAGPCRPLPAVTRGSVPGWSRLVAATKNSRSGARPGALGARAASAGVGTAALGPGAAIALARPDGRAPTAGPLTPDALRSAVTRGRLVVVDLGSVGTGTGRAARVAAADRLLGELLPAAGSADVVVAALADDGSPARVRPLVVHAPGLDGQVLTSPSTRQPGLVLLTDLAPTLTGLLGISPDATWTGEPVVAAGAASATDRLAAARDIDLVAGRAQRLVAPFFVGWVVVQLGLYLLLAVLARTGVLTAGRARRLAALVATVAAAVPAATFLARLVPWWRTGTPGLAVTAVTVGTAAVIAALAWVGPWRRHPLGPLAVVAAATVLVVVGDVATGSGLTISSLIGEHPVVGGRFYGLGNASSGLVAAATLLVMTAVAEAGVESGRRRAAGVLALLLGLAVVAVVAWPGLGADFGGTVALLPAVLLLGLHALGVRLRTGRVAAMGVVSVAVVAVVCMLDWLRPPAQRTHLGRFADAVVNGGGGDVVGRKLIQNWTIFTSSPLTMLVPFAMLLVAWALWRPRLVPGRPLDRAFARLPMLRPGLLAVVVMLLLAMAVNDSGVTVPAPVALLVLPLLVTVLLRVRDRSGGTNGTTSARHRAVRDT